MLTAYAEININTNILTFYYKDINLNEYAIIEPRSGYYTKDNNAIFLLTEDTYILDYDDLNWWIYKDIIIKVVFDKSFINFKPLYTSHWFYSMENIKSIEGMEYLNTDDLIDCRSMFARCHNLETIDLSHFNTTKVQNMSFMFLECFKLTQLDLSTFSNDGLVLETPKDTAYGKGIAGMFENCHLLKTIFVSNKWKDNLLFANWGWVFKDCPALIGGQGSIPDDPEYDGPFAHVDGGEEDPGYFTLKKED